RTQAARNASPRAGEASTLWAVADKVWTAEELEAMSPAEQDAIFQASLVFDLTEVPEALLEQARARVREHIANTETPKR
ncbi:MAG: hypothetical protein L0206_21275, partial [Actinobacteria bacterium]|nr:hypothetical protein [Actinomycetota bacterium]